jgi:molecular chaperone GrpE
MKDNNKRVAVPISADDDAADEADGGDVTTPADTEPQVDPHLRRRAEQAYAGGRLAEDPGAADTDAPPPAADGQAPQIDAAADTDWKALYEQEHEKYLRAVADLQNYRRRVAADAQQQRRFANENLLCELLPVTDNCNQALQAIEAAVDADSVAQGVTMILDQLLGFIEQNGVVRIDPEGEQFDAARHEAVEAVATADVPENTIVGVVQPGYMLHDRLLRPAKVRVAVAPQ